MAVRIICGVLAACAGLTLPFGRSWSEAAGEEIAAAASPPAAKPQQLVNSIGMKLVRIPAGSFVMGSPADEAESADDERPQHRVSVSQAFYMGAHEVTQGQFARVMQKRPSFFSETGPGKQMVAGRDTDQFPAEQVTWHDAVEFCRRLSVRPPEKNAGRVYRLPTEAEWEYACRAGTETPFHFGRQLSSRQANFNGALPYGGAERGPFLARTQPVGSYPPNAFGVYDMHGNVTEWCADWHDRSYYQTSPRVDPRGSEHGAARVIRGGDWYSDARDCRSAFRYADIPAGIFYVLGFRVVMTHAAPVGAAEASQTSRPAAPAIGPDDDMRPPALTRTAGEDWPTWRGPRGDGTWHGPKLPDLWPKTGLRRLWRASVGGGYAGVAVAEGRVYTMDRQTTPDEVERTLCYEAATGKILWEDRYRVEYKDLSYGNGPRAMPTVVQGRVYALGALGDLACLQADSGKVLWRVQLAADRGAKIPMWGLAASPLVFENLVVVHAGAQPNGCFLAVDRHTGNEVWRNVDDPAGYATPILIERGGRAHLVCWSSQSVCGLEPRSGRLLWSVPFTVTNGTSIATPIHHAGMVVVSGYYEGSKAIRLSDDFSTAEILWEDRLNLRGLMSQPIYRDGRGYLLDKRHGLTCFDFQTGRKLWDDGNQMTPKGRNPQATLVWTGHENRALILNSEGELILAGLDGKAYRELSRTRVIGPTWAHPAYAGNCVFARNDEELICASLLEAASPPAEAP